MKLSDGQRRKKESLQEEAYKLQNEGGLTTRQILEVFKARGVPIKTHGTVAVYIKKYANRIQ